MSEETPNRGPRGGNLENSTAGARNAHFEGKLIPGVGLALHRLGDSDFQDKAVQGLQKEKPWHRLAAYMFLNGRTTAEVAKAADVTNATVVHLRGQRWFQELLGTLAEEHGQAVNMLLQSEALESIEVMRATRDDENLTPGLRYRAAKDLLEHAHGKAVQRVIAETTTRHYSSPKEEMDDILQQLEAARSAARDEVYPSTIVVEASREENLEARSET